MRNIELKARISDLDAARAVCERIGAIHEGLLHQVDTYFPSRTGRLKLRELDPGDDQLILYHRADVADSKASEYSVVHVDAAVKQQLAEAFGVTAVVDKSRDLWLWKNVRIHLDTVKELGTYLEFEAVLSEKHDDADGYEKIAGLRREFGIQDTDVIDGSYADLIGIDGK